MQAEARVNELERTGSVHKRGGATMAQKEEECRELRTQLQRLQGDLRRARENTKRIQEKEDELKELRKRRPSCHWKHEESRADFNRAESNWISTDSLNAAKANLADHISAPYLSHQYLLSKLESINVDIMKVECELVGGYLAEILQIWHDDG